MSLYRSSYMLTLDWNRVNCSPRAIKYTVVKFLTRMHKIALIRNSKKLDILVAVCQELPVANCSCFPPTLPPTYLCLRNSVLFIGYLDMFSHCSSIPAISGTSMWNLRKRYRAIVRLLLIVIFIWRAEYFIWDSVYFELGIF